MNGAQGRNDRMPAPLPWRQASAVHWAYLVIALTPGESRSAGDGITAGLG